MLATIDTQVIQRALADIEAERFGERLCSRRHRMQIARREWVDVVLHGDVPLVYDVIDHWDGHLYRELVRRDQWDVCRALAYPEAEDFAALVDNSVGDWA